MIVPIWGSSMCSKWMKGLKQLSILFLMCSSLSCQKFLDDQPEKPKAIQVELDHLKCLNDVGPVFSDYFQAKFEKSKWNGAWACLDQAVVEFVNGNKGEKADVYLGSELKRFFKKLFAKVFDKEISDELVDEILKLKYSLLGGEVDQVSKFELEQLRGFFVLLAQEMESLNPYLGVLLFRDDLNIKNSFDKQKVDQAVLVLRSSVLKILKNFKVTGNTYTLPEIKLLITEVQKFSQGSVSQESSFSKWSSKLPFLEKLRAIFIGTKIEITDSRDVENIWMLLIDVFESVLYYAKGINSVEWSGASDFQITNNWVESNLEILLATFQWKKKQEIAFSDLDYIIDELSKEKFWPKKLSANTFKLTYRRFVSRVLDAQHDDRIMALTYDHILQLRREYQSFALIQKVLLEKVFINADKSLAEHLKVDTVRQRLVQMDIKKEFADYTKFNLGSERLFTLSWNNYLKLVDISKVDIAKDDLTATDIQKAKIDRHFNSQFQLEVVPKKERPNWHYRDLWVMNLYRWSVQALMGGFVLDAKRLQTHDYMTIAELQDVYTEFLDFCQQMGIFDERTQNTWERSQKEADLFTPSGNGDGLIQFAEMADLFAMMYSGGLVSTLKIHDLAKQKNYHLQNQIDIFGNYFIQYAGFYEILKNDFAVVFPNLPHFAKYVSGLKGEDWQRFYYSALGVGRLCDNNNIGVETADLRTLNTVLNYVEDLFNIYDVDRNQGFDMNEVEVAYDRFADFIIKITKERVYSASPLLYGTIDFADGWHTAGLRVFKYLIFNGRAPDGPELLGFVWDELFDNLSYPDADRGQILKVFSSLKSEIAKSKPKCGTY